jgi:hypothetical protein
LDAVGFILLFTKAYPELVTAERERLSQSVYPMLAGTQHGMTVSTFAHSEVCATLKLGKASTGSTAALGPAKCTGRVKLSSVEARILTAVTIRSMQRAWMGIPNPADDTVAFNAAKLTTVGPSEGGSRPVKSVAWRPPSHGQRNAAVMFTSMDSAPERASLVKVDAALAPVPSSSSAFSREDGLTSLFEILTELNPSEWHASPGWLLQRAGTILSSIVAWWQYHIAHASGFDLPWISALYAGIHTTLLPHFPFKPSSLGGDPHRKPAFDGLNVRIMLLLSLCLPGAHCSEPRVQSAVHDRLPVKGSDSARLSYAWITPTITTLQQLLSSDILHAGTPCVCVMCP